MGRDAPREGLDQWGAFVLQCPACQVGQPQGVGFPGDQRPDDRPPSFRNGGGTCNFGPTTAQAPPCNNDVFYAFSINGGVTWSAPFNVTPASKFGPTAQWQAWGAVSPDGHALWVGYYDRSYGRCETTGCNDITLARILKPTSASPLAGYTRVTTSSMPNLVPANNPVQAGFLGDYMWVATDASGRPHVVWADTRGRRGTVEEDVYFAKFGDRDDDDWFRH